LRLRQQKQIIPKALLVDSRGGFPNRGRADSSWRGRFAPCHQRSDCERTIRRRRFGRSPVGRRTPTRAGGFCRWPRSGTAWTGARRRRSAGWTARRCVTGSIASTGRVRRASSTTGRRVPSLAFRRSNWLGSRRSSRRVRIMRRTASCAGGGSTSSASSPRGSASSFIRAMSESFCRSLASPTSARGRAIRLRTSGRRGFQKNFPHALKAHLLGLPETTPVEIWFEMLWSRGLCQTGKAPHLEPERLHVFECLPSDHLSRYRTELFLLGHRVSSARKRQG